MNAVYSEERDQWHPLWKLMWVVTTPTWIAIAFLWSITEPGRWWVSPTAFILLFLVPELVSIKRRHDRLPPLTHMIRGYVDDDFAFPAIYFLVGALGGRWFGFPVTRLVGLGVIAGMLGWLTIHFTLSYLGPDPRAVVAAGPIGLEEVGADDSESEVVSGRRRRHIEL